MHMKAFSHFLKKFLNDKYPHVDFDFLFLASCAKYSYGFESYNIN